MPYGCWAVVTYARSSAVPPPPPPVVPLEAPLSSSSPPHATSPSANAPAATTAARRQAHERRVTFLAPLSCAQRCPRARLRADRRDHTRAAAEVVNIGTKSVPLCATPHGHWDLGDRTPGGDRAGTR